MPGRKKNKGKYKGSALTAWANNKGKNIDVDGGLGPATIGALKGVELDRVRAFRVKYYVDLITARPEQEKFFLGWFRRATEV